MVEFKKKFKIYILGIKFFLVLFIGNVCVLNCVYCGKYYFEGMRKFECGEFLSYCFRLVEEGYNGCFLSGGMDGCLKVFFDFYVNEIKEIKKRMNFKFNVYVGFIDESDLEWVKYVDVVFFDFVGDNDVIRCVYKIDKIVDDYLRVFDILIEVGVRVVLYIMIGLDFGKIYWEYKVIDMLVKYLIDVFVFDVLILIKGIEMENVLKLSVEESFEVVKYVCEMFDGELSIGCMRFFGRWRLEFDRGVILIGVDRLMNLFRKVIEWVKGIRDVEIIYECCVM